MTLNFVTLNLELLNFMISFRGKSEGLRLENDVWKLKYVNQ